MTNARENIQQNYGTLIMRPFKIAGNEINAFYDSKNRLVFVLDNTINAAKPNVLLVINPDGDKKWDEILADDYGVDLETIRPKLDNKYQKFDIEYSGVAVYDNLIRAYMADEDIKDYVEQLNVLRNAAMRHGAMTRLDAASDVITKTNATIVKTKESIIRLQTRIKGLRSRLADVKKEIGRVPTKQSASRVLKLESQIDAGTEKLKRAQKRLDAAQKRLDVATADAEIASALLNQEMPENTDKKHPVVVAQKHEIQRMPADTLPATLDDDINDFDDDDDDVNDMEYVSAMDSESGADDVKPLFDRDPEILNDDIAFKPISFNTPVFNDVAPETTPTPAPTFSEKVSETTRPILESFEPIVSTDESTFKNTRPDIDMANFSKMENTDSEELSFVPIIEPPVSPDLTTPVAPDVSDVLNNKIVDMGVPNLSGDDIMPTTPVASAMPSAPVPPAAAVAPVTPVAPAAPVMPVAAGANNMKIESGRAKQSFIYYVLLVILIALSVFTLWLYQQNVKISSPTLAPRAEETVTAETPEQIAAPVLDETGPDVVSVEADFDDGDVFLDVESDDLMVAPEYDEPSLESDISPDEDVAPEIIGAVPSRVTTSPTVESEVVDSYNEDDVVATKPVFEPGGKSDSVIVSPEYQNENESVRYDDNEYDNPFYDAEEEAFLSGDTGW